MVKPRPSGCPDARGTLPAYLVPRMSNPPLGTCQTDLKHGLEWGKVPFNSFGLCISDAFTKNLIITDYPKRTFHNDAITIMV